MAALPGVTGEGYRDASGQTYLPMFREPVLVFGVKVAELIRPADRAGSREVAFAAFMEQLFETVTTRAVGLRAADCCVSACPPLARNRSDLPHPAIDTELSARDVARLVAEEEQRCRRNFLRARHAAERAFEALCGWALAHGDAIKTPALHMTGPERPSKLRGTDAV